MAMRYNQVVVSAVCMCMLLYSGVAHRAPPPPPPQMPGIPGLFPPFLGIDIQKCWSSILSVEGCVWEIYMAIFSFQFGTLGPACCRAIITIDENCWAKMFPLTPIFPPLLKTTCVRSPPSPPTA